LKGLPYIHDARVAFAALALAGLFACQTTRVEHHRRPAFFEKASTQKLENEVVLDDGTVLKFHSSHKQGVVGLQGNDGSKPFQIREEDEEGNITLRAVLPEHVLINALACIRNQEYQLMWEQLLADRTRLDYEDNGGFEAFASYLSKNRHDLVATLTRMVAGIPSQEVSFTRLDDVVTRCRLRPQIAEGFRFKIVDVAKEMGELKLATIQ